MRVQKRIVELTGDEYRTMLHCLIGFRNQLISEGRYTDAVDELILKLEKCRKHQRWFWRGRSLRSCRNTLPKNSRTSVTAGLF